MGYKMKILAIMGSPNIKGNTDLLLDEILEGLKENSAKGHDFEKISLINYDIKPCNGCYACEETEYCPNNPTASEIVEKILNANLVIIGTPIYFFNMSSLLKLLWDHFIMFSHPKLSKLVKNKKFALFSVSGSKEESIADSFYNDAKETEDFYKFKIIGTLRITGFEESGIVKDDEKAMKKAHDFGVELCEKLNL